MIALDRYDALMSQDPQLAWTLLDILADTGREALLFGQRFLVIVRSDDRDIAIPAVGARGVEWNRREWGR